MMLDCFFFITFAQFLSHRFGSDGALLCLEHIVAGIARYEAK